MAIKPKTPHSKAFVYSGKSASYAKESDRRFNTELEAYNSLKAKWYDKLAKEGFKDIEDSNQRLYQPDTRTLAYQSQDDIREFYLALDEYLVTHEDIPAIERKVLEMYSSGHSHQQDIMRAVKRSRSYVAKVIRKYKALITGKLQE